MNRIGIALAGLVILCASCKKEEAPKLATGDWLAKIEVSESQQLPFEFTLSQNEEGGYVMQAFNAEEVVTIDEFTFNGDSINIRMPVFEGHITGTYTTDRISGEFIEESKERRVPFVATYGKQDRFTVNEDAAVNLSGIWETYFDVNTEDEYAAKGIFMQNGNRLKGTFRTKTGDYRYLDGVVTGDSMKLSAFDGSHVFLFLAEVTDSTLNGKFYSGNHSVEEFMAARNEAFELPDSNELTYLREGYDKFDFTFPNSDGEMVGLDDPMFKDKAVLVQIMGTWCPNCLDETRFYVDFVKNNPDLDLQLVGLAFEYAKTEEKAFEGIQRLQEREDVPYPILLAQYGTSNKQKANEKLPMLNHILSYPTTIYIDKSGEVRKIHTGFNGPATGEKFVEFKEEFNKTIQELTSE
ncbi:peroxiredoxin family protein [Flagellimonas sp. MMG031]|uniref:TlpA disulfide reductase family protein n=1 Tax=Flagellimonas sp. MMG031 TaxID=3158549 RepID=A0AAU7MW09_9FLAO|nr:TlpA disulfide reductase family protein [Allomuricauda sp.]MBO6532025.1 TlpA family protein disulfide reductase [Allomuricauda sp.]MBO6589136.1 TlpA family protein disulfide reductase [Allomuricauda sp.]MBO6618761.1 TlpA family protein disulfide reductase [Allomuricauda sp.]MBO6644674.1 TlpA family protein disulfide reductase [Allomuricauda sp.]MBO6746574.1 TlpA family protein disulfide reductase [Allomuricauda sp.]